jgi:hypothetical protein
MRSRNILALGLLTALSADSARQSLFNPSPMGPDNSIAHKDLSLELIAPKAKRNRAQYKREQKVARRRK